MGHSLLEYVNYFALSSRDLIRSDIGQVSLVANLRF